MKFFFILLLSTLIVLPVSAQTKKETKKIWHSPDPKGMKFIPPGSFETLVDGEDKTLSIQGFWMSNEITNKEFNKFYQDIKQYPDSSFKWLDLRNHNENDNITIIEIKFESITNSIEDKSFTFEDGRTLIEHLRDPDLRNHPVSGITYDMAINFCRWKNIKENTKNKGNYINDFRLPVELEWEYVANNDYNKLGFQEPYRKSNKGKSNTYGLKNLDSNVSEFINSANEGNRVFTKGSSYKEYIQCKAITSHNSEYRSSDTGFRIVRTFLGKRKDIY